MKKKLLLTCLLATALCSAALAGNLSKTKLVAFLTECQRYEGVEVVQLGRVATGAIKATIRIAAGEDPDVRDALRDAQILVIDTVGLLSRLYRYGFAAYVGGSFTEGTPHSVVEPASYGMPVSFGPHYRRETHCRDLVALGAGFPISDGKGLEAFYAKAAGDNAFLEASSRAARAYCLRNAGATEAILDTIFA